MDDAIKCNSKTYNHTEQLGDLAYLCDDVLGVVIDFLPNKDLYSVTLLSNSYLYKQVLHRRYCAFKNKRDRK